MGTTAASPLAAHHLALREGRSGLGVAERTVVDHGEPVPLPCGQTPHTALRPARTGATPVRARRRHPRASVVRAGPCDRECAPGSAALSPESADLPYPPR